jgi:hypothetical protein
MFRRMVIGVRASVGAVGVSARAFSSMVKVMVEATVVVRKPRRLKPTLPAFRAFLRPEISRDCSVGFSRITAKFPPHGTNPRCDVEVVKSGESHVASTLFLARA